MGTSDSKRVHTVLLADDDRSVRTFATRVLRRAGYRVLVAESGDAALAEIEREGSAIDLLVTDVVMPGLDGAELAARARELHPSLRVLFMSGYPADLTTGERLVPMGAALLQKPFASEGILTRVAAMLED